ncbi:hypothetical protein [Nonomuraea sp. NPDC049695]|uniref:hypothetical protein n=1 Tax=Nonomuraea sp. NPDC049695 TaxID=3154734 RepID=UPI0034232BF8
MPERYCLDCEPPPASLLQAGDNLADTPTGSYADQITAATQGMKGAVEVLEELAAKAKSYEASTARDR